MKAWRWAGVAAVVVLGFTGCIATPAVPPPAAQPPAPQVPPAVAAPVGSVTPLPPLSLPRAAHTATLLPDGRVLVVGGCTSAGCGGTPQGGRTDVYDPQKRTFASGPSLAQARAGHTATALAGGGVLITGGYPDEGRPPLATAELFDPRTNEFSGAGSMTAARGGHTATRLADGRVLVVGGYSGSALIAGVEIYDPQTGRFTAAAPLAPARAIHAATALADGTVLVVGGQITRTTMTDSAVLYDPSLDIWTQIASLHEAKYKLAAAPLPGGGALIVGGQTVDARDARLRTTEVYDPSTRSFRAGPTLAEPRFKISDALAVLPDGGVVIGGGGSTVEVYRDGRLEVLSGRLGGERQFPTATALADGTVLITGGYDNLTNVTAETFLANPG